MMEQEELRPGEDELMELEENCRKNLRTIYKAVLMRLVIVVLVVVMLIRAPGDPWVLALMALVMIINLATFFPLLKELQKQYRTLAEIQDQYE